MSAMTGSGASAFDNLLTLAQFCQTPEFLERIKELRDLEESSKLAVEMSAKAAKKLADSIKVHEEDKAEHAKKVAQLDIDRVAFETRKNRVSQAMTVLRQALE